MGNEDYMELAERIRAMAGRERERGTPCGTIREMVIGRITALSGCRDERSYTETQLLGLLELAAPPPFPDTGEHGRFTVAAGSHAGNGTV